eukprot:766480-Hanusia_phi.AAC.3
MEVWSTACFQPSLMCELQVQSSTVESNVANLCKSILRLIAMIVQLVCRKDCDTSEIEEGIANKVI